MIDNIVWCTCTSKGKNEGYTRIDYPGTESEVWGHKQCGKPTYLYWISIVLLEKYWKELDEIIARIIEGKELEDGFDKGRAETACLFIGLLVRPHDPDIKSIRDMALKRYRTSHVTRP